MNAKVSASKIGCLIVMAIAAGSASLAAQDKPAFWHVTTLYAFTGNADGAQPEGGVVLDPAGNVYGTTTYGGDFGGENCGTAGCGVAFKIDPRGHEGLLHSFTGPSADGANPSEGVTRDSAGRLFGLTPFALALYELQPRATVCAALLCPWNELMLSNIPDGGQIGDLPTGIPILDGQGNIYATSNTGGSGTTCNGGCGFVFKVDPQGQFAPFYNFQGGADGALPTGPMLLAADGSLYGTTVSGGNGGFGTVYKIDANGTESIVYPFTGGNDGGSPYSGVIADEQGNLYGTTVVGGLHSNTCIGGTCGVVFELIPNQNGSWTEHVLYSFQGGADGGNPYGGLVRDSQANFYGTTYYGGICEYGPYCGTAYKLDSTGNKTTLWNFQCGTDGCEPEFGSLVMDQQGNLYGTTSYGGDLRVTNPACLEFLAAALSSNSHPKRQRTDLTRPRLVRMLVAPANIAAFGPDVCHAVAPSAFNRIKENFMNARMNARIVCALMMVASISTVNAQERSQSRQLTTLYTFLGEADGASPGEVGLDPAGNLYGITTFGGDASCGQSGGCGVAFKLNARGHESILHTFTSPPDGANSYVGLLRDSSGVFYGETLDGGSNGAGIIFKLTPPPTACASVLCPWHETILHQFSGGSGDGAYPYGDLIEDSSGSIYGTTQGGGNAGSGTVFKLGSAGNESVLYSFPGYPTDGAFPSGGLLRDRAGNLYGVTTNGGTSNAGTVFELSPSGSGWTEQVLYSFTGGSDGFLPIAGLIADEQGNLYGTTDAGGDLHCGALGSCGVVFELSPNLNGTWSETVLHTFTGVPDGAAPWVGALISDSAGNLYGTTQYGGIATGCPFGSGGCGTVFELSPNGSGWTENILYSFMGGADGSEPIGPVTMDANGNLYGAAFNGGDLNSNNPACTFNGSPVGCGTVFKLTP